MILQASSKKRIALLKTFASQQSGRQQSIEVYLENLYRAYAERNPEAAQDGEETA
jgi:hypothetical protein